MRDVGHNRPGHHDGGVGEEQFPALVANPGIVDVLGAIEKLMAERPGAAKPPD